MGKSGGRMRRPNDWQHPARTPRKHRPATRRTGPAVPTERPTRSGFSNWKQNGLNHRWIAPSVRGAGRYVVASDDLSMMVNVLPRPGLLCTETSPP